ncbi:MarR family winged helix-turn-helix transcriptional regulator [Humisphaera borealis]|uniref:Winged helix-turn-helix transcriptional regulator n=1 Tax=Humisphaera borealis TaxID=2807512 RepID=A0A7M2WTL4_9BACT|nr:MarR family winged helix-turn-helix transcriptional regulator [Humisphaera borealis]QOV88502.1 winged helix-turn-helix transcriptional regulator [Humisphaera borealis]
MQAVEFPQPRNASEAAFRSIVRTSVLLRRMMEPYFEQHGISGAQWAVLRALERAESKSFRHLRVNELSDWLLVRPPSITSVVSRLRRDGLVRQEVCRDDHRARQLSLTAGGRRLVARVLEGHAERIEMVLSPLEEPERDQLAALLERVADHMGALADTTDLPKPAVLGSGVGPGSHD